MTAFENKMKETADAIRNKTGGTEGITINNFPNEIDNIGNNAPNLYTINAKVTPENSGIVEGLGSVTENVKMILTAKPNTANYYHFKNWKENGVIKETTDNYSFVVNGDKEITATFEQILPKYKIDVAINPNGYGTVNGQGEYELGSRVNLSAIPNTNCKFENYTENNTVISTQPNYSFTINKNRNLVANFINANSMDWIKIENAINESSFSSYNLVYNPLRPNVGFVTFSGTSKKMYYSTDGLTWTNFKSKGTSVSLSSYTLTAFGTSYYFFPSSKTDKIYDFSNITSVTDSDWESFGRIPSTYYQSGDKIPAYIEKGSSKYAILLPKKSTSFSIYNYSGTSNFFSGWVNKNLPSSKVWSSVVAINNIFYMTCKDSNILLYSSDGQTWNETTLPVTDKWVSMAYGNGKYVIIPSTGTKVLYSTDAINWKESILPESSSWTKVIYGGDRFVAISYNKIVYSKDGVNWYSSICPFNNISTIAYGADKFIIQNLGNIAYFIP